jgi:hypothetical protein
MSAVSFGFLPGPLGVAVLAAFCLGVGLFLGRHYLRAVAAQRRQQAIRQRQRQQFWGYE